MEELAAIGKAYEAKASPGCRRWHSASASTPAVARSRTLVQAAHLSAGKSGLPRTRRPAAGAGLMFAFGSGVRNDPLFPWVAASVAPEAAAQPRARLERLAARAQTYVRQAHESRSKG